MLEGRWKLLFTTRPGSASPIQKAFIGIDAFTVYQEISGAAGQGRVNNVVDFGPKLGYLKAGQLAAMFPFHLVTSPPGKTPVHLPHHANTSNGKQQMIYTSGQK